MNLNTTVAVEDEPKPCSFCHHMMIKKATVLSLIERLSAVDNLSRRKNLNPEDKQVLSTMALTALRAALSILRKLK